MQNILSRYTIEIYTPLNVLVADLTGIAQIESIKLARNKAGSCSFRIGLKNLEYLAKALHITVRDLLAINRNEVRVRKGDFVLFGGQINYFESMLEQNMLSVRSVGFWKLFEYAFTGNVVTEYADTDQGEILDDVVSGRFGVTTGSITTSITRDRTYPEYKNIKEIGDQLSEVINGIDFEIDYLKRLNVYYPQGLDKTDDILFIYPGNIKKIKIPTDGTQMLNKVTARGQGFGEAQSIVVAQSTPHQTYYNIREDVLDLSDVSEVATLTSHAEARLELLKDSLEIPEITIDGNQQPYLGSYWLGDRIKLQVEDFSTYKYLSENVYRIEAITININQNDQEDITLSLSKYVS